MPVSVIMAPESIWGYEAMTAAYGESPADSWQKIHDHAIALAPCADEGEIIRLIGRRPAK